GARVGASLSGAAGLAGTRPLLLLHHLGEALRALAHGVERATLRIDGAVRIAFAQRAFGFAHGLAGAAELVHLALALALLLALLTLPRLLLSLLALLVLAEPALAQLLQKLLQLLLQRLLILLQLAELLALVALLALLPLLLLTLLAALPTLLALLATLVLALTEGFVAQLLLLADHVAEFVERRHHVVAVVAVHLAGTCGLQVLQDRLQLLEQAAGRVLGARARQVLDAVGHLAQILGPDLAGVAVERARELLRVLAHLLGERLHELVERGAQLVGEAFDLLVGGAAFECLPQVLLRLAQRRLGI